MPWSETVEMSRFKFIADFESCLYEMTQLCEKHGISRKTGYKWAKRFGREGVESLKDRSRAPKHRSPSNQAQGCRATVGVAPPAPDLGTPQVAGLAGEA